MKNIDLYEKNSDKLACFVLCIVMTVPVFAATPREIEVQHVGNIGFAVLVK